MERIEPSPEKGSVPNDDTSERSHTRLVVEAPPHASEFENVPIIPDHQDKKTELIDSKSKADKIAPELGRYSSITWKSDEDAILYLRKKSRFAMWVKAAIVVTWAAIVVTLFYSLLALVVAIEVHSVSLLAYALESFVDTVSSFFVVWRFWGAWGQASLFREEDAREEQASVGISVFFIVVAGIVLVTAFQQLVTHEGPSTNGWLLFLAALGVVLSIIFGIAKYITAKRTNSMVLEKDAWASFCGAVLSLGTLVAALAYKKNHAIWWIDAATAIVIGILLFIYGLWGWCIYPWWRVDFWTRK